MAGKDQNLKIDNPPHFLTTTEWRAAIAAHRNPLVQRAAKELSLRAGDGEVDPDPVATAEAQRLLTISIAQALEELAADFPEKVHAYAMQAALFAVGGSIFLAPPEVGMAEWIASMPDDALDGLRKSMAETASAIGDDEYAERLLKEPKETFSASVAESVPGATSGLIVDLGTILDFLSANEPLDSQGEVIKAQFADAAHAEIRKLEDIAARQIRLVKLLRNFSYSYVVSILSGLLTLPENHTGTARIEVLLHLAAVACRGKKRPGMRHVREWLAQIDEDPITKLENPIEDVFISNVETHFGNARLFQGRWENNGEYVRTCIETLLEIAQERPWARKALRHLSVLLRVSDALAKRATVERNVATESKPGEKIGIRSSTIERSSRHVVFSKEDLAAMRVDSDALHPFSIQVDETIVLEGQELGNSFLERRPLLRCQDFTTVALPTAIGASIRRFAIEQAAGAGDLRLFQSTYHILQFSEVFLIGQAGWGVQYLEKLEPDPNEDSREFIGTFDEGGYVHVVFIPDNFQSVAEEGLASVCQIEEQVIQRMRDQAAAIESRQGYRRGLSVLVHGGIGRSFSSALDDCQKFPTNWHQLSVSMPDFMTLANMSDFTALRAWKLLAQVSKLETKDILFVNLRGFPNLFEFARSTDFNLAPENMCAGTMYLHSDLMLQMRYQVRNSLDRHAVRGPDGESWVAVQRQQVGHGLEGVQGPEVYLSPAHKAHGKAIACIKSASKAWWVHVGGQVPAERWPHAVVVNVLDVVLGWLARLVPEFEERYRSLPEDSVAFQLRFTNIEGFSQIGSEIEENVFAPAATVIDGEIVIDCNPSYLQSFLQPGNLGDRLMIAAIVRGVSTLCRVEPLADSAIQDWIENVARSANDRFPKMNVSSSPQDLIYDFVLLRDLRLPMPEDLAWSRLNLARLAGYEGAPGPIPNSQAPDCLKSAVDLLWARVKERLGTLSRESTIERTLENYLSAKKEHRDWMRAMKARLTVYDAEHVMDVSTDRVVQRDIASLVSRVVTEMALCESQYCGGDVCTDTDMDFLIANVWALVECGNHSDALRYRLADGPPAMHPNGSFEFDATASGASSTMMIKSWRRKFLDETEQSDKNDAFLESEFQQAFATEFGIMPEQYGKFAFQAAIEAMNAGTAALKLRRSEVVRRLREVGAKNANRAFEALVLSPRNKWDESQPANAEARDWYPWRTNRRLSILRRPFIKLSPEGDPLIFVAPSILADALDYLAMAKDGGRTANLFDSPEMIAFIGRAADRNGHEFARKVENRLSELGWEAKRELGLTQFGGEDSLGDIDVLSWYPSSGEVYVIECKSLRFDSTLGEIGERLMEFAVGTVDGDRSPLQKHLDRMAYLEANRKALEKFTGIPASQLQLRSGLVTETLGPLQFAGDARKFLDVVTDFELLAEQFLK